MTSKQKFPLIQIMLGFQSNLHQNTVSKFNGNGIFIKKDSHHFHLQASQRSGEPLLGMIISTIFLNAKPFSGSLKLKNSGIILSIQRK